MSQPAFQYSPNSVRNAIVLNHPLRDAPHAPITVKGGAAKTSPKDTWNRSIPSVADTVSNFHHNAPSSHGRTSELGVNFQPLLPRPVRDGGGGGGTANAFGCPSRESPSRTSLTPHLGRCSNVISWATPLVPVQTTSSQRGLLTARRSTIRNAPNSSFLPPSPSAFTPSSPRLSLLRSATSSTIPPSIDAASSRPQQNDKVPNGVPVSRAASLPKSSLNEKFVSAVPTERHFSSGANIGEDDYQQVGDLFLNSSRCFDNMDELRCAHTECHLIRP